MLRARYRRIVWFFARLLLSFIFWDLFLPRIGLRGYSQRTRPARLHRAASAFRALAVRMGGVMIKVGQFLSSRVDVLPPEVTLELVGLQDEVPAEPFEHIRQVAEAEFGVPLGEKFAAIESRPLAAASLGQVHRARLRVPQNPGEQPAVANFNVVIKVQRPDIERIVATDLAALHTVGRWVNRFRLVRKRADVPALLQEFDRILYQELDYLSEGRNAETFDANFKDYPGVRVPRVVWTHTTRRVLTLENVFAIKITDYEIFEAAGISRVEVASRLLDTYLKQIFEDGFFHADPHPGNLFVTPLPRASESSKRKWLLTFVDFGMVGQVPDNLRSGLREMLIGIGTQDPSRVLNSFKMMDMLLPSADMELLERAVAREFELFWGKSMSELNAISFDQVREFADEFRDLLFDMPFQVPQNAIFLARCVGILAGMCTGLDPQFNLWDHVTPYAQKLMAEEAKAGLEIWLSEVEKLVRTLAILPGRMDSVFYKLERGEVAVRTPELSREVQKLESAIRQVGSGVVFAALLLGGIQLYLGDEALFGGILLAGAGIDLLWMLLFGRRHNND